MKYQPENPVPIAEFWERWCGETPWSVELRKFASLGGLVTYYCGVPRSCSAIPLTFQLHKPDGAEIQGNSRLKDIRAAIKEIAQCQ